MYVVIKNAEVFTGRMFVRNGYVVIKDDKIVDVLGEEDSNDVPKDACLIDAKGNYLSPGFIDTHVHGAGGADSGDATVESVARIAKTHARFGTTSLLISITPHTYQNLIKRIEAVKDYIHGQNNEGAKVLGIHLEGPYVNPKEKGGMRREFFRQPDVDELYKLIGASGNTIKMLTIAPELKGAVEIIKACQEYGIRVAVGHSDASYEEMVCGINAGISHVTHIFNALRHIHHRDPGVIGTVLINNEVSVELIADTHHVHSAVIALLLMIKGTEKIVLVTDSMRVTGLNRRNFRYDGRQVKVANGVVRLSDGTIVGSILTMNKAVKNIVNTGRVPLEDALKMATVNPARVIGISNIKSNLLPGRDADLVVFDKEFNVLLTMVEGRIVHTRL